MEGDSSAAQAVVRFLSRALRCRTIIVPGHGHPVSNRSGLRDYRDMLIAIRENVAALKRQDSSLDDTIAAKPIAAYDANPSSVPVK